MTKEMAYEYLQYYKTMDDYTDSYSVVDTYFEESYRGKNLVIKCEYKEDGITKNKYIHTDPSKIAHWIEYHRETILNKIIK